MIIVGSMPLLATATTMVPTMMVALMVPTMIMPTMIMMVALSLVVYPSTPASEDPIGQGAVHPQREIMPVLA